MTSFTSFLVHLQCSKTCGRGLRKRSVFCSSTDPGAKAVVVPDSMCRQHHKPKAQETCVLRRCPKNERLQWIPTPWGEVGRKRHEALGAVTIKVTCCFQLNNFCRKSTVKAFVKIVIGKKIYEGLLLCLSILLFCGLHVFKYRAHNLTLKHLQHSHNMQLHKAPGVNIQL